MKALEVQDIPWNWGGRKCRFASAYMLVKRSMDRSRWRAATFLCALFMTTTMTVPDSARGEGLFDFLFGGFMRQGSPPETNARTSPSPGVDRVAPPPLGHESVNGGGSIGHSVAFCVRLCDGHHFPIEQMIYGTATETCRAICPYSKTKIFFGSEIRSAVAKDGQHYADLETAFAYRKQLAPNCTCNGRDVLGLTSLNVKNDPTLRPGDIVSTVDGLLAFAGKSEQGAVFTPVNPAVLPANLRPGTSPSAPPQSTEPPVEDDPGTILPLEKKQLQNAAPAAAPQNQGPR
jgi:hypothetical protein